MKGRSFTGYTTRVIGTGVLIALVSAYPARAQTDAACRQRHFGRFSEWSAAVNMGPVVNSANLEFWPSISPNGLSLYFGSNRPGGIPPAPGADLQDIWVTRRASLDAPWGEPRNLGPNINSAFRDNSPVRTETKYKVAVAVENCPSKLTLLNQITDNEKKERFMWRITRSIKIVQYIEPSSPLWRC